MSESRSVQDLDEWTIKIYDAGGVGQKATCRSHFALMKGRRGRQSIVIIFQCTEAGETHQKLYGVHHASRITRTGTRAQKNKRGVSPRSGQ